MGKEQIDSGTEGLVGLLGEVVESALGLKRCTQLLLAFGTLLLFGGA